MNRLRQTREAQGISQRTLSKFCKIGESMVYRYENGLSEPSANHLKLIADVLQVSVDYLLERTDDPQGLMSPSDLNYYEREMVDAMRREGWPGVFKLGAERISKLGK